MLADVLLRSFLRAVNHFVLLFDTHSTHARADFSFHTLLICVCWGVSLHILFVCVRGSVAQMPWHTCGGQRTASQNQFSLGLFSMGSRNQPRVIRLAGQVPLATGSFL